MTVSLRWSHRHSPGGGDRGHTPETGFHFHIESVGRMRVGLCPLATETSSLREWEAQSISVVDPVEFLIEPGQTASQPGLFPSRDLSHRNVL